ncbi:hypothetical protein ACFLYP_01295 [Chloroflexota bacterium]
MMKLFLVQSMIPISPHVMRISILVCQLVMTLLAVFYLRRRRLTTWEYVLWGLLALLLPILGPYLVISSRPGESRQDW